MLSIKRSTLASIKVGARSSPLSKIQVEEVAKELPGIALIPIWVETTGDLDQKTSLRTLDKTNFFTKEVDALLLKGNIRLGIHSAKDLPEPFPDGLQIVAVTKGVDPSDSLVLRDGESLKQGMVIATSSERREEAVSTLCEGLTFIDIRGKIGERLARLNSGEADGIVIAEAALIRLGLTHLNRITLPGETTPGQGQLAILAREGDTEMETLFASLDTRKTVFYTGLEAPQSDAFRKIVHHPLIKIEPRPFQNPPPCTHIIFTSKTAATFFTPEYLRDKTVVAVGKKTAERLPKADIIAESETAEGIVEELKKLDLKKGHIFWPHSALSRPVISHYLKENSISYEEAILYDTLPNRPDPLPNLRTFDEILFTSPSTVEAFLQFYGKLPDNVTCTAIGPVTEEKLSCTNIPLPSK